MLRPATVLDGVLSNKFATVTLTCGTLQKQVKSALTTNNIGDEGTRDQMANDMIKVIREMALHQAEEDLPDLRTGLTRGLGHFFSQCGLKLADQFQCHYLRNTTELVLRLRQYNPGWCEGEGEAILSTINLQKGTSTVHDQLSLFVTLNSHLPPSHQMSFAPESGFQDQYITITKRHFVEAWFAQEDVKEKGRPGQLQDAIDDISDHPEDLFFQMFMGRQNYTKHTFLMSPNLDCDTTYDRALLIPHGEALERLQGITEHMKDKDQHKEARESLKDFYRSQIPDPIVYKELVDNQETYSKYVLTGTICTNGYDLQVLAYSLLTPKPLSHPQVNTTRVKLEDVAQAFADQEAIDRALAERHDDFIIVGMDPGIHNTVTATVVDTRSPRLFKNISISEGAQKHCTTRYLRGLEHVKRKVRYDAQYAGEPASTSRSVQEIETHIKGIECPLAQEGDQASAWQALAASLRAHVVSVLEVQRHLRQFYTTGLYKYKAFTHKQAKQATKNMAVDRIISATEVTGKWRPGSGPRPIFVVGDGSFGTERGVVRCQDFISLLKKKVPRCEMALI
ncbi:unnamed protein product [Mortierella alpina]